MTQPSSAIRLGIDLGNTGMRAAYVYPDGGRAVVPLPVPPTYSGLRLPLYESLQHDISAPPFFPGITQRIQASYLIRMGDERQTTVRLVGKAMATVTATAKSYSSLPVESVLLTIPAWQSAESRAVLREVILQETGVPRVVLAAHTDAAAAYARAEILGDRKHETALIVSIGYTGSQVAIARLMQRGHRVLAEAASEGLLAGNRLDFLILQSALHQLRINEIAVLGDRDANQDNVNLWAGVQRRVEVAKQQLDAGDQADFLFPQALLPHSAVDRMLNLDLSAFHKEISKQLVVLVEMIDGLLQEAGIDERDLDHIVLEGGGVHLRRVSARLAQKCPRGELVYLPKDALAAGAALLAMEDEFLERFDAPLSTSEDRFLPELPLVPELAQLVSAPASARETRPPEPEQAIEDVSLTQLRGMAESDLDRAMRRLLELEEAVRAQIKALQLAKIGP